MISACGYLDVRDRLQPPRPEPGRRPAGQAGLCSEWPPKQTGTAPRLRLRPRAGGRMMIACASFGRCAVL